MHLGSASSHGLEASESDEESKLSRKRKKSRRKSGSRERSSSPRPRSNSQAIEGPVKQKVMHPTHCVYSVIVRLVHVPMHTDTGLACANTSRTRIYLLRICIKAKGARKNSI